MHRIKIFLLVISFMLTLRLSQFIPSLLILNELWIVLVLFSFMCVMVYLMLKRHGLKFTAFEYYIIALCFSPLYLAVMAYFEFGQPLLYGVLSGRSIWLVAAPFLLLQAHRLKLVDQHDIERSLVILSWFLLVACLLLNAFGNPSAYAETAGLVGGNDVIGYEFIFPVSLLVFATLYYFVMGVQSQNTRYYVLAMPFLLFLVLVDGGRSLIVSLMAAGVYLSWRYISFTRLMVWGPKLLLMAVGVLILLMTIKPDYMAELGEKFSDAFLVVMSGESGNDASANARIYEIKTATPYIEKNWLFGNGHLSHKWEDGYESKLGYFFPSDIGLVGILYKYGVVGFIFFMFQFYFIFKFRKFIPKDKRSAFILAIEGYLLYMVFHSLVTGEFVGYVEVGLLFISILYIEAEKIQREKQMKRCEMGC